MRESFLAEIEATNKLVSNHTRFQGDGHVLPGKSDQDWAACGCGKTAKAMVAARKESC